MPSTAEKIIEFEQYKKNHVKQEENLDKLEQFDELSREMRELVYSSLFRTVDSDSGKRIIELEKENQKMRCKLQKAIPLHIIVYLVINAIVVGISACLLILRFIYKIYTLPPYYVICAFLIGITLFLTALVAIKDWRDFLNER